MAAISAHGPRTGTIEAYARALETGAEYVEFDIRRTADGELAASTTRARGRARYWPPSATPGCASWQATRCPGWRT